MITPVAKDFPSTKRINWPEILLFYIVAVGVSAPFRLGWVKPELLLPLPGGLNLVYAILRGIGPAVGFFVVVHILNSKVDRPISFWGTNKLYSLLAILPIPVGLTLIGVDNDLGLNRQYYGLLTGLMFVFYALGEEYGWRGYLQPALASLKTPYRILLIALLWYGWHLNFLRSSISYQTHILHFLSLVAGSWGFLRLAAATRSILFVAAVHLSFNLMTEVAGVLRHKLILLGLAITSWVFLVRAIDRNEKTPLSK